MTELQGGPDRTEGDLPAADEATVYERHLTKVIECLTSVAGLQTAPEGAGDVAEFAALALASAAANVGGIDRLLAGRPGSWEAELVAGLVNGTILDEPDELARRRTATVVVSINVAEIVEDRLNLLGLNDAIARIDNHYDDLDDAT